MRLSPLALALLSTGCLVGFEQVVVETRETVVEGEGTETVTSTTQSTVATDSTTTTSPETSTSVPETAGSDLSPFASSFAPLLRLDADSMDFGAMGVALPSLDTDSGLIDSPALPAPTNFPEVTWSSVPQDAGSFDPAHVRELGVLQVHDLIVPAGETLSITGERPLVIIASGTIRIEGILDAAADKTLPGSGGFAGSGTITSGNPALGPGAATLATGAGGGGGYLTRGGGQDGDTSMAGPAVALSTPMPLFGGSGGYVNSTGNTTSGAGGAGGGAVYLLAQEAIIIGVAAGDPAQSGIHVGGGGGDPSGGSSSRGAGGGSGGTIVLDAPQVTVHGTLAANGGSGSINRFTDGRNANFSAVPAAGITDGANTGGDGGAGDTPAGDGAGTHGSGGGSAGRIFVYASETLTWGAGSVVSPSIASGGAVAVSP